MTSATNHRLAMQELKAQEKAARKAERERQKRVARDEAAERRRAAKSGFANVANPRRSTLMTVLCSIFAIYCLFPFVYLLINATKSQADFTSTFGLWFGGEFNLWDNIVTVFTYQDGIFGRWFLNTILYVVVGAGGATLLAIMGGYALAKFRFPGRKAVFAVIIGSISVPGTALAVPQFLLAAHPRQQLLDLAAADLARHILKQGAFQQQPGGIAFLHQRRVDAADPGAPLGKHLHQPVVVQGGDGLVHGGAAHLQQSGQFPFVQRLAGLQAQRHNIHAQYPAGVGAVVLAPAGRRDQQVHRGFSPFFGLLQLIYQLKSPLTSPPGIFCAKPQKSPEKSGKIASCNSVFAVLS